MTTTTKHHVRVEKPTGAFCSCGWEGPPTFDAARDHQRSQPVPAGPRFGYHYIDRHTTQPDALAALQRTVLTPTQTAAFVSALLLPDSHLGVLPTPAHIKHSAGGTFEWPTPSNPGGTLRLSRTRTTADVVVHEAAHWRHFRIDPTIKGRRGHRTPWHGHDFVVQLDKLALRSLPICDTITS